MRKPAQPNHIFTSRPTPILRKSVCRRELCDYASRIKIEIRQAQTNHLSTIVAFNLAIAAETEALQLDHDRVRRGVEAVLADAAKGTYFIAEIDSQAAGQLLITREWSDWRNGDFWWIQSVYVQAGFRGCGVFRALFEHVRAAAKSRPDVCGLRLYMDAHNVRARAAYEKLGMKRTNYEVYEVDFVLAGRGGKQGDAKPFAVDPGLKPD